MSSNVTDELAARGAVAVQGVLATDVVDAAARTFADTFGALDEAQIAARASEDSTPILCVGERRYEITVTMSGGFGAPALFANERLSALLGRLLGSDFQMNSFTVVASYPGAAMQGIHRDHAQLFGDESIDAGLPPFAVSIAAPLVDLEESLGPTGFFSGSHRWASGRRLVQEELTAPLLRRGDALIMDYRTIHAGLPNVSQRVRPILYLVYARPWFFDERNHRRRLPIDIAPDARARFTPRVQAMLARAWAAHARR